MVPIITAGTITDRSGSWCLLGTLLAAFQPIRIHYELATAKFIRKRLICFNDISLAIDLRIQVKKIEELEKELTKHIKVQQGLETVFQITINTILASYAYSSTKTRQGLAAVFTKDALVFMGITISPEIIIAVLLTLNSLSLIRTHMSGFSMGYGSNYSLLGKLLLFLYIALAIVVRIMSMTLYFTPMLGLFNLLHHPQGLYSINIADWNWILECVGHVYQLLTPLLFQLKWLVSKIWIHTIVICQCFPAYNFLSIIPILIQSPTFREVNILIQEQCSGVLHTLFMIQCHWRFMCNFLF